MNKTLGPEHAFREGDPVPDIYVVKQPVIPVKIKHQIVANTVVVLENGDVIVGQAVASEAVMQVGVKDDRGQQAYEVKWTLKIGRPSNG